MEMFNSPDHRQKLLPRSTVLLGFQKYAAEVFADTSNPVDKPVVRAQSQEINLCSRSNDPVCRNSIPQKFYFFSDSTSNLPPFIQLNTSSKLFKCS